MEIVTPMSGMGNATMSDVLGTARRAVKRLFSDYSAGTAATTMYTPYVGATNYVQRKFVNSGRKYKRPKKNARQAHKLLDATTANCIQVWKRMINYEKFNCAERLPNNQSPFHQFNIPIDHSYFGSSTGGEFSADSQRFPVYIFDLNCVRSLNPSGDIVTPVPMYRLIADETGANAGILRWEGIGGFTPSGNTDTQNSFSIEVNRGPSGGANPTECAVGFQALLNWSDIRMSLYGATDTETKFTVSLVQFKDICYVPEQAFNTLPPVQIRMRNVNYTNMLKSLVFHPLDHGTKDTRKQWIRTLATKSYVVGPTTAGADTTPAVQSNVGIRLFKRMNRKCNFQWVLTDTEQATNAAGHKIDIEADGLDQPNYDQQLGKDWNSYVHPKARVYLMITATCYNPKNVTTSSVDGFQKDVGAASTSFTGYLPNNAYSTANTPCFDLLVRNSWQYDF